jgi:hypothetical protein
MRAPLKAAGAGIKKMQFYIRVNSFLHKSAAKKKMMHLSKKPSANLVWTA